MNANDYRWRDIWRLLAVNVSTLSLILFAPAWLWLRGLLLCVFALGFYLFGYVVWAIPTFLIGIAPIAMHPFHQLCEWCASWMRGVPFDPIKRYQD